MVWSEIKFCQEVGPYYGLFHIRDNEGKGEYLSSYCDYVSHATVTGNRRAICGRKLSSVWTLSSLGGERWEDRQESTPINQPLEFCFGVADIQQISCFCIAGRSGIYLRRPAGSFPAGLFWCCPLNWHPGSQL